MSEPNRKKADPEVARKAEEAIIAWLRGERDKVECVRTRDGNEHVMVWDRPDET